MTRAEQRAAKWLYDGGSGWEGEKGDEKASTWSFWGLVSALASYEEYLKSPKSICKER